MRGRYKAWAKPFLESHAEFCVPRIDPADSFYDHRPLCLEIGIGKGDFILGYSELFPEGHYLGLERDVSIMGMAAICIPPQKHRSENSIDQSGP